ncbi:MAG: FimB/Mfa2 family fimbrial subunit, partial [Odoribacteraceae bacterium]|nr:FimB/Mfa2 family fimbrial subunit [Odoribacteraceae bacterium]
MKGRNTIHRVTIALLATTIFSFVSCVRDLNGSRNIHASDSTALVTLSLTTPATRATRAPATSIDGTATENAISTIDVLLFDEGGASMPFLYRAHGTKIEDQTTVPAVAPDPLATKKFEVRLPIGGPYNIVVLANARAEIAALSLPIATIVTGGISRANVLNGLESSLPTGDKMGKTNFPMWGYVNPVTIDGSSSVITPDVQLTRAVARVDVSVTNGVDFVLTSARLYNYHDRGHVAPEATASNYNTTAVYPAGAKQEDVSVYYAISESGS